ncbi:hypothetical protein BGZ61DRAFT_404172 [Ilyonectria robusta]|uniref:uncharacterized protein n=1 Tax=Ilyonectria robusta TaxID=1079257 RepID=UPI001E8DA471|nr:uncharacterized protein BGZ61DRAFT_404172 [Ilyonectria robusta]KAH8658583.1 hypothetical protein BGZ61DRAFT_404172 [Ilyonectria robusta]
MRVAVIGGGASGLVQLKTLLHAHEHLGCDEFEPRLFEASSKVGGVFHSHVYEDAELVSSKYLTSFSDFRPKPDDEDFLSAERYVEYLEEYATHFGLWKWIDLETKVVNIKRQGGGHVVVYQKPNGTIEEWPCEAVAICSGVHSKPNIPSISGIEHVPTVMHSSDFKTRAQLGKDKTVMVLGSGETGADVLYVSITADTKRVVLCHRSGWVGAPKRNPHQQVLPWLFGYAPPEEKTLPVDVAQITLFDTMYVHPIVRDSMIVWNYYHTLALPIATWVGSGSKYGIDMHVGQVWGERFHISRLFLNKAWTRVSPYIYYPWIPERWTLATRIRRFLMARDLPRPSRTIDVAPFPSHISEDGVAHFPIVPNRPESERIQQSTIKPDILIYATGYVPTFPFLDTSSSDNPYPTSTQADVRAVWKRDDPSVGFIGFVRPNFGAIPALAELQSMLFIQNLVGQLPPLDPEDEYHYRLIVPPSARIGYGVEHDSYAYQLAKDMTIAPSFTDILRLSFGASRGWRLPWVWAAGGALNPKFRLVGPWKWDGAADVLTGECWETISRRKNIFGNLSIAVLPMIYLGSWSLYYWAYSHFWNGLARIGVAKPLEIENVPKRLMEELALKEMM